MPVMITSEAIFNNPNAKMIRIDHLVGSEANPRVMYETQELYDLAASIKEHGVIHPLFVYPLGDERFEIVAGHRRYSAVLYANEKLLDPDQQIEYLSCTVAQNMTPGQRALVALAENLQRSDVAPEDLHNAVRTLITSEKWTRADIANRLHKTQAWLSQNLAALEDPVASELLFAGLASYRQCLEIARAEDTATKHQMADRILHPERYAHEITNSRERPDSARKLKLLRHLAEGTRTTDQSVVGLAHRQIARAAENGNQYQVDSLLEAVSRPAPITAPRHAPKNVRDEIIKRKCLATLREVTVQIAARDDWEPHQVTEITAYAQQLIAL